MDDYAAEQEKEIDELFARMRAYNDDLRREAAQRRQMVALFVLLLVSGAAVVVMGIALIVR